MDVNVMPGKKCPFCNKLTLFGNSCTSCHSSVKTPINEGRGGKGKQCPFCKTMTLFNEKNGLKCSMCQRTFIKG